MQITAFLSAVAALGAAGAAAAPTVYLCGDSTMAAKGANDGSTDGWGQYFAKYTTGTAAVVNRAMGGRSARSYTKEGRFNDVANLVKTGDIVVIEFGHNDGGSPQQERQRPLRLPGHGQGGLLLGQDGRGRLHVRLLRGAGGQDVRRPRRHRRPELADAQQPLGGRQVRRRGPRFVGYQATAARQMGNAGVTFVDHFQAVANSYKRLGNAGTNALYPKDHTHTSPAGADLSAQAFAQAIATSMNGTTALKNYIVANYPRPY
ncbi:SGNH hydrolase-type esterase domain-containing protein [Apiospora saccharicola]